MNNLEKLAKLIRYFILLCSTEAGSGHPTSSLSATELMTVLMFGGFFKFDLKNRQNPNNDRLIFSKGHASPLFYSLYAAAGAITEEELKSLRKFGSRLEGHPTMAFPFTEAATGSLGQGLSIGVGMALNAKYLDKLPYTTYVLLGDSEMAEGSMWEAISSACFYKLDNLVAILDVNRLGQRGQTMYGHDLKAYQNRIESFGWSTYIVEGHDTQKINKILKLVQEDKSRKPKMIIAKTIKGKGVSFLEDKEGKHGVALKPEEFERAKDELGKVDLKLRGKISAPKQVKLPVISIRPAGEKSADSSLTLGMTQYSLDQKVATRKAYGNAITRIYPKYPEMVVLDAEVSNSTYADIFKKAFPERFFEMYIAEQNMVGVAIGLSRRGKIPFVSTFAAFLSRSFDQIRMSQYSEANIKFVGSHAGVSIGEDGASQMALEDLAMFRTLLNSVVLYPSDAVSTEKLVEEAAKHRGNVYIRTTRMETLVLYGEKEKFEIGGSKIHRSKRQDAGGKNKKITIVGAGVTLHEALKAQTELAESGIEIVVVDLYSVKPVDEKTLKTLAKESKTIITVEDHFAEGGIGEAVRSALAGEDVKIYSLAVRKMPKSGKPEELLNYEGISAKVIIKKVKQLIK